MVNEKNDMKTLSEAVKKVLIETGDCVKSLPTVSDTLEPGDISCRRLATRWSPGIFRAAGWRRSGARGYFVPPVGCAPEPGDIACRRSAALRNCIIYVK
jgi:hypothetical protein